MNRVVGIVVSVCAVLSAGSLGFNGYEHHQQLQ